jgi:cold shock CspA family protein
MQGKIARFFPDKGFGFIWTEAAEWFFHESQVIGEVRRGDFVEFWLDDDPRHRSELIAVEVRRIAS